jgi:hypothetical protein
MLSICRTAKNSVQTTFYKRYGQPFLAKKKCTKIWCKTLIPLDAKFKACDTCRTRDQEAQKKKRSRKKASHNKVSTGLKRGLDSVPDTQERPTRRARTADGIVGVPGVAIDLEDDEDGLCGSHMIR